MAYHQFQPISGGSTQMSYHLIGFQLANMQGVNIQGNDENPTNLARSDVMTPQTAWSVIAKLPSFLLIPVFEGDVDHPSFVNSYMLRVPQSHSKKNIGLYSSSRMLRFASASL